MIFVDDLRIYPLLKKIRRKQLILKKLNKYTSVKHE